MKINKAITGICILLLFSAIALASISSESDISLEYKLDSGTRRNTINESNAQLTYNLRSGTQPQVLTENSIRLDITPTNTPPKIIDTNNLFNFKALTTEVVWAALSLVFNNSFGTIDFEETIDISRRSTVDLDTFVSISSNYISINGTTLSEFNKSTILSIRNLAFSNVRILKNGEDCLGCTILSYSGGNAQFQIDNLPGFAIYQTSDGSVNPAIRIATNAVVSSTSMNVTGDTYNSIYPSNVTIDVGSDGTPEFSQAKDYNSSTLFTNFTNALNSILPACACSGCTLSNSNLTCTIVLNITSDTAGVIELSELNITQVINNASWNEDNNYTLIDLDDYFYDADRDNLSYTYSNTSNISVSISDGIVSLRPALNFFGTRTIAFNASDGTNKTVSNNVTLTINSVNDVPTFTNVPSQSWVKNTNNTNAFNLDNHFSDVETASLTYNVYKINNTGNITVTIDGDNNVSFYSVANWIGTEFAYFTAYDGIINVSSNNLTLSVTEVVPPSVGGGESAAAEGGGGAEGGAGPAKKPEEIISNFSLTLDLIKISLVQGKTKTTGFKISNTGDTTQRIRIEPHEFPLALFLDEIEFSLAPGESKTITVDISAMKELPPEIYSGKIYIKSGSITRVVRLIVEVEPRVALFDIIVRLPRASKRGILRGEEVQADISMFNMGDLKPVDVELEYSIKDIEGNVITGRTETLAVETENGITRGLQIPEGAEFGDYLFYAKITYANEKAVASELFEVVKERPSLIKYYFPYVLGIGIGIVLFILGIVMFILPLRVWKTPRTKENELKLVFKQKLLLEKEKQKELKLELQKKELVEKLKKERIKEQEKLVREKIRFRKLEFGRKSRENRERKLQMREFLRILGIYKTKADKKEQERKEEKERKLETIEKRKREIRIKRERKEKGTILKRTRTRRLHELFHAFGLHKTEKEKRREASRKPPVEKQRELEKKRALKEQRKKEEKEIKKRKAEYEKRRKAELKLKKELNKNVLKFNILSERAKQLIKDKKLSSVISSYIKLKLTYDKLIAIPLKSEEKKDAFVRLNNVYVWICNEKQAKTREKEIKRKNLLENARERKTKEIQQEAKKNKQETLRKQVEEENKVNEQREAEEKLRLREQRKQEKERKRLDEENKERREARRRKRKKEFYKTLHNLGLYKTEKEKKERLRELKKKELQRKRLESIKKKRKLAELERRSQEERIENAKRIRELEKNKKKDIRLKKKLAKGKLRFESNLKKAEEYITKKNFPKVVMSYAQLRSIYNKLTVLPISNKDKDELYSRLDKIYLWISREKQAKQKRKEAKRKNNEGTLARKRKEDSRLKELKQQQEEQERQKRISEKLEKERIEKEEIERRRKLEEIKRTEDEKKNLKELHKKYKTEKNIEKKAELLKAKDLTKTKGIKQRILKERKDNLESKKKIVEFNSLIINTASQLKKRSKKELSILFEDLCHKYQQLLSYNLHPKDKTQIKVRMRWIKDKIGA